MSKIRQTILCISIFNPLFLQAAAPWPTNITVLTREDFKARPIFSVADALDGVPGINIEQDGFIGTQAKAKIRGGPSSRVIVFLDGIPLTHEFDGQVDLSQIPLSMVDRIEISRGGSSVGLGAEATAGAINIITSRPTRVGLVTDLGTGVGRYGASDLNGRFLGRSYLGDATYTASQQRSAGFIENEGLKANNHFGNISRSFNGKGFWGLEYLFHESKIGLPNGTPAPFDQWNGHIEKEATTRGPTRSQEMQHLKLLLATPKINEGTFYSTLIQSWRNLNIREESNRPSIQNEDTVATTLDLKYTRKTFETGAQSRQLKRSTYPRPKEKTYQNGIYILNRWTLGKATLVPGLRYDHLGKSGGNLNPRLTASAQISDPLLISANISRSFRAPTFDELFVDSSTVHNSHVDPERAWSYDAGVAWSPVEKTTLKLTGFASRVTDLITADAATNQWTNNGTEKTSGIESDLSTEWKSVTVSANWTQQTSQRKTPAFTDDVDSALTPHDIFFVRLDNSLPLNMKLSNEWRYQSEQFSGDNRTGMRIAPYYVWDVRWSLQILKADLYFAVKNLTRRHTADTVQFNLSPQADRTFWTGINILFLN